MTDIFDKLMATKLWGEREIKLGIEFDFKCAYCDKNMFDSVDNYKEWQTDHIVPSSKNGDDSYENCVLSCRTCNFIKSTWNPLENMVDKSATRSELIEACKKHITDKRAIIQFQIDEYKRIVGKHS
ncbi:HNH endonuclease [Vibrio metschnikovii]|uniref:HNH endonuclease n=1 Tax=Vibrio metschnikovii TaxID=28172 RepID=UPI001C2F4092|nr:HNH endonuclease signature motif containing protein [Vibrio metschnikovii]